MLLLTGFKIIKVTNFYNECLIRVLKCCFWHFHFQSIHSWLMVWGRDTIPPFFPYCVDNCFFINTFLFQLMGQILPLYTQVMWRNGSFSGLSLLLHNPFVYLWSNITLYKLPNFHSKTDSGMASPHSLFFFLRSVLTSVCFIFLHIKFRNILLSSMNNLV